MAGVQEDASELIFGEDLDGNADEDGTTCLCNAEVAMMHTSDLIETLCTHHCGSSRRIPLTSSRHITISSLRAA